MKKIKFIIKNLFRIIFSPLLSLFVRRNGHYIMFNAKFGKNHEVFLHNTKYLFLYLNHYFRDSGFRFFWLCDNKEMVKAFKEHGYSNVLQRKSIKGIYYMLKSNYFLYDFLPADLPQMFIHNAILINLWHGTGGLKKSAADDEKRGQNKLNKFQQFIYNLLRFKDDYYTVDSENEKKYRKTMFGAKDNQMVITGSPRLDVLYHDFNNQDLFMEEDFAKIKMLKEAGKKLFFYTPTFRDTDKDISGWLKSDKLKEFLKLNNAVLVCKLHPFDANSLNFELTEDFYKMDSDSDIYPVLKYSDALITDYSSIYFDYLILDKPIIYYVPDLEEFQAQCRGFYEPYENLTAGAIVDTEPKLLSALQDVIDGIDNYKKKRKILRCRTFKYLDGHNCERVIEFIRSLDK